MSHRRRLRADRPTTFKREENNNRDATEEEREGTKVGGRLNYRSARSLPLFQVRARTAWATARRR